MRVFHLLHFAFSILSYTYLGNQEPKLLTEVMVSQAKATEREGLNLECWLPQNFLCVLQGEAINLYR